MHVVAKDVSDKKKKKGIEVKISLINYIYMPPFWSKHCHHVHGRGISWKMSLLRCFKRGPCLLACIILLVYCFKCHAALLLSPTPEPYGEL